mmetsp:Transcript_25828/g.80866  ORF Transcript_25828/g.80866 Transcript_25828/m.80866 type:complete len:302 (+) Transcript_25828:763-1668(+)
MFDLPDSSDTSTRRVLPTVSGGKCSYDSGASAMACACIPPLCANAERPTKGAPLLGVRLATSSTYRDSSVSRGTDCGVRREYAPPLLRARQAAMETRSALPHRSPIPLIVPCTTDAPAETAASEFATASAQSLWQCTCTLTAGPTASTAARTNLSTSAGIVPPLVSQRAMLSAPAAAAARSVASACSWFARKPSKKCSASYTTRRPEAATKPTESAIISRFSSRLTRRTSRTWKSQVLPTMVHTSASERSSASMPSSFEAEMPLRRVMPNAATVACRRLSRRTCSKKATSFSFESGYPPSI